MFLVNCHKESLVTERSRWSFQPYLFWGGRWSEFGRFWRLITTLPVYFNHPDSEPTSLIRIFAIVKFPLSMQSSVLICPVKDKIDSIRLLTFWLFILTTLPLLVILYYIIQSKMSISELWNRSLGVEYFKASQLLSLLEVKSVYPT